MRLSRYFTSHEMTRSQTATRRGIDNSPTPSAIQNLRQTCSLLEEVRALLDGQPVIITSGYRSPALNRRIGGSRRSHHCLGYAADFICPNFGTPSMIAQAIRNSSMTFDQLIHEGSWVHISAHPQERRQCLTAVFHRGRAHYRRGIAA